MRRVKRLYRRYKRIKRIVRQRAGWNLVGWPVVLYRKAVFAVVGIVTAIPIVVVMLYMVVVTC